MPEHNPSQRPSLFDLLALVAVLATGVTLVALGVSAANLAEVTIALSSLYSTWRLGPGSRDTPPPANDSPDPSVATVPVSSPGEDQVKESASP